MRFSVMKIAAMHQCIYIHVDIGTYVSQDSSQLPATDENAYVADVDRHKNLVHGKQIDLRQSNQTIVSSIFHFKQQAQFVAPTFLVHRRTLRKL